MYVLNITDEYDRFTNCTHNENDVNIIVKSFLSINPRKRTITLSPKFDNKNLKPSITNEKLINFPTQLIQCTVS